MIYPRWLQDLSRADFLKSVGLYIMPDRLFLVRMGKNLFRLSVIEEEEREIRHGQDTASRQQALREAIRSLLPHFNPAEDPLYICLSPDQAVAFDIFLPRAAEGDLSRVVEYEVERHLPFRREEGYYDFLPTGKKGDKVGLLLFAVPKRRLDEILGALAAFGIKPRGVEMTATALANYLLFCTGEIRGPALLLGGQNQAWEVVGLNAGTNGWRQVPEMAFAHWLPQVDWVEGPGREIFYDCLRQSPKLFGWGYSADFLLSVGAESIQLDDLLALGKKRFVEDKGIGHSFFLPAVGAALRGLREATFTVNLLPATRKERQGKALSWLNACLTILLAAGLIVWGGSYPIKDEIRLRQIQRENQKLAPSVEALRHEDEELKRLRKEISFVSGIRERKGEILQTLDELSRIVPNSAYLSNLRFRDGAVELQGSAENASNLVPLLERSPLFKNVGFNAPSNRGRDNRETFSLKAELERAEGKTTKP